MKRTAQLFFVTCFLAFLFGVAALTLLMPKAWSSYYENRSLTRSEERRVGKECRY